MIAWLYRIWLQNLTHCRYLPSLYRRRLRTGLASFLGCSCAGFKTIFQQWQVLITCKSLRCATSDASWASHIRAHPNNSTMCQRHTERLSSLAKSMLAGPKTFFSTRMVKVIAQDAIIYKYSKYNYESKDLRRGSKHEKLWANVSFLLYKIFNASQVDKHIW